MSRPVFLSYAWDDMPEADDLDAMLRLRGIPVWRDRRQMRWGGYNEDLVRMAIRDDTSGFALYLTEKVVGSDFITGVELPAMDQRRTADSRFFAGAVFRGYGVNDGAKAIHELTGIDLKTSLGSVMEEQALLSGLRDTANSIAREYLRANWCSGPATACVETRNQLPAESPALLHLSLAPPLAHDVDEYEVAVWDEQIQPALVDLQNSLHTIEAGRPDCERILEVDGSMHLSVALAIGYAFRETTRWGLRMRHTDGMWEPGRTRGELAGWTVTCRPGSDLHGDLVVMIHVSADVTNAVRQSPGGMARAELQFTPPGGVSRLALDPTTANAAAAGIVERIREARAAYAPSETRLFVAAPWPFVALLGWHLGSCGAVVMHEANAQRNVYRVSCVLR